MFTAGDQRRDEHIGDMRWLRWFRHKGPRSDSAYIVQRMFTREQVHDVVEEDMKLIGGGR